MFNKPSKNTHKDANIDDGFNDLNDFENSDLNLDSRLELKPDNKPTKQGYGYSSSSQHKQPVSFDDDDDDLTEKLLKKDANRVKSSFNDDNDVDNFDNFDLNQPNKTSNKNIQNSSVNTNSFDEENDDEDVDFNQHSTQSSKTSKPLSTSNSKKTVFQTNNTDDDDDDDEDDFGTKKTSSKKATKNDDDGLDEFGFPKNAPKPKKSYMFLVPTLLIGLLLGGGLYALNEAGYGSLDKIKGGLTGTKTPTSQENSHKNKDLDKDSNIDVDSKPDLDVETKKPAIMSADPAPTPVKPQLIAPPPLDKAPALLIPKPAPVVPSASVITPPSPMTAAVVKPVNTGNDLQTCTALIQKHAPKIQFQPKINELNSSSKAALNPLLSCLKHYTVHITGHTDAKGTPERKAIVSDLRANTVKAYLIEKGIPVNQLTAQGMADSKPLGDNETESGRAKNRRIEIAIEPLR